MLNKTIGDAVMAVFNFPIRQGDHTRQAVLAARAIQDRWKARGEKGDLGIGVGIHCGELSFGEFGRSHRDLTAIGTVVNLASRAQTAAAAGEILVTQAVYERAGPELAGSRAQQFQLKGFEAPTMLYAA